MNNETKRISAITKKKFVIPVLGFVIFNHLLEALELIISVNIYMAMMLGDMSRLRLTNF